MPLNTSSHNKETHQYNPLPQNAPGTYVRYSQYWKFYIASNNLGAAAAVGHTLENSIPLSIFPVATDKFCICFCGIPGRGKTHISRRLGRYLEFFHAIPVHVYHVADYRRKLHGALPDAEFFDPDNSRAAHWREEASHAAIHDMTMFLNEHTNGVAILDMINENHFKRQSVMDSVRKMIFEIYSCSLNRSVLDSLHWSKGYVD